MNSFTLLIKPAAGLCNMRCSYCFYRAASEPRENRIMTQETVDVLIEKIRAYRPASLSVLFQGGEPLLAGLPFFKAFVKKVQEAVRCPVHYALQTNGLLLDDACAAFFREHGFLIGLSLDGDRRTNDRYRLDKNGRSTFARVLTAAETLRRHGVDFNILSVIDDKNAAEFETTYAFFKAQGFDCLQCIPCVDEGDGVSLSADAYEAFLKKCFDLWYADFQNGRYVSIRHIDNYIGVLLGHPPENCAMCGICGNYFVVEANGDLYPCDFYCKAAYRLGSVFDDAPFEANETQRRFVEASRVIHAHCKTCRYYALCRGGCRRDRIDGFTKNQYCTAYCNFFEYAADRMVQAAKVILAQENRA